MCKLIFLSRVCQYIGLSCPITSFAAANYHSSGEVNGVTIIYIIQ